jgi:hypothetical protein
MYETPETPKDLGKHDARFWLREIEAAKSRLSDWHEDAEEAEEAYCDEKERGFGRLNIFWANVETQKAAIGEDFGKPEVTRVNMPEDDDGLARHVANVWERAIAAAVDDTKDNHDIALAVSDMFLPGRGVVWQEVEAEDSQDGKPRWVKAPIVRVCWRDYLEGKAARWGSVPWVSRAHEFTRDELVSECKMSEAAAAKVPLNVACDVKEIGGKRLSKKDQEQFKRARVWEIWTKFPSKLRIYVAEGYYDDVLAVDDDPYKLKDFFPCARPMLANGDEGWQKPITDYSRYEDQAKELDKVCQRIYVLTDLLRNRGAYDKRFKELADLMKSEDGTFVAIENWAELQAKGGLEAVIQAMDLETIAVVIDKLKMQRRDLIELIYELSGVSDLARGQTDPQETLGAQKLKKSFGSGRFRMREDRSREFAAEAYGIKGEIIAEMFPREQLEEMTGLKLPLRADIDAAKEQLEQIQMEMQRAAEVAQRQAQQQAQRTGQPPAPPQPPQPPLPPEEMKRLQKLAATRWAWEDVDGVLSSDYRRCYACKVETDQSKFVDEQADQANRAQFFQAVMMTFEKVAPMIAGNPKVGEVWKQLIMFVISSYKAGRSLEEGLERTIDEAIQQAVQQSQQQQQIDPNVAAQQETAKLKVQAQQIGLERDKLKLQADGGKVQEVAVKAQIKQAEGQQKLSQAEQKRQIDEAAGAQKIAQQQQLNEAKQIGGAIDMQNKVEQLNFERTQRATAREMTLRDGVAKEAARPKPKPQQRTAQ